MDFKNEKILVFLLASIHTGEDEQIEIPHHIPMDNYIQEAEILYHWPQAEKETG
jgi:hypothetical protein